jgi:hypothetical protein
MTDQKRPPLHDWTKPARCYPARRCEQADKCGRHRAPLSSPLFEGQFDASLRNKSHMPVCPMFIERKNLSAHADRSEKTIGPVNSL